MVEANTGLIPPDQSVQEGKENWFSKVPTVLTFKLSGFVINQILRQSGKKKLMTSWYFFRLFILTGTWARAKRLFEIRDSVFES